MNIRQIFFLILLIISKYSYTQDTIISMSYSRFDDDANMFIKTFEKQNVVYVFTVNNTELKGIKINIKTDTHDDIDESFESGTREIRNIFFTDTSFVVLLRSKQKNKNTFKYEYSFNQEAAIKSYINLDAFDDIDILSTNVVNNEMVFLSTDKKDTKLIVNRIDNNLKTHTAQFDIAGLIAMSGLKKGEFKNEFFAKETPISYDGDKDLFAIAKSKKYYFSGDTVFMISGNVGKGTIGIIILDIVNNKSSYLGIKRDESFCKKDKKDFIYHSTSFYNNMLLTSRGCNHYLDISFYNIFNGNLIKQYSIDSTNSNYIKNITAQEINFNRNKVSTISNINDEILGKLFSHPFFISCISTSENSFLLTTGVYREKGPSALVIVGTLALNAFNFYNSIVLAPIGSQLDYYIPMGFSSRFFTKQAIADTRFIAAGFNKSTLAEEPEVLKKLNDYDNNPVNKNKKENARSIPFTYNGRNAMLEYNRESESLAIFYLK